jgi:predicted trehalose synthase
MKDIATLLWSLRSVGALALATRPTSTPIERDRLAQWMHSWVTTGAMSLLSAYRRTIAGMPFLPQEDPAAVALLRVFMFERAFDDIARSVTAQPEWLETVTDGALGLLS